MADTPKTTTAKDTTIKKKVVVEVIGNITDWLTKSVKINDEAKDRVVNISYRVEQVGVKQAIRELQQHKVSIDEITRSFEQAANKIRDFRSALQFAGHVVGYTLQQSIGFDNRLESLNRNYVPTTGDYNNLKPIIRNVRNNVGQGMSPEQAAYMFSQASEYLSPEQKRRLEQGDQKAMDETSAAVSSIGKGAKSLARVFGGENDTQYIAAMTDLMIKNRINTKMSDDTTNQYIKTLTVLAKHSNLTASEFANLNLKLTEQAKVLGYTGESANKYVTSMHATNAALSQFNLTVEDYTGGTLLDAKLGDMDALTKQMMRNAALGLDILEMDPKTIQEAQERERKLLLGDMTSKTAKNNPEQFMAGYFLLSNLYGLNLTTDQAFNVGQGKRDLVDTNKTTGVTDLAQQYLKDAQTIIEGTTTLNYTGAMRKIEESNMKLAMETATAFSELSKQVNAAAGFIQDLIRGVNPGNSPAFNGALGGIELVGLGTATYLTTKGVSGLTRKGLAAGRSALRALFGKGTAAAGAKVLASAGGAAATGEAIGSAGSAAAGGAASSAVGGAAPSAVGGAASAVTLSTLLNMSMGAIAAGGVATVAAAAGLVVTTALGSYAVTRYIRKLIEDDENLRIGIKQKFDPKDYENKAVVNLEKLSGLFANNLEAMREYKAAHPERYGPNSPTPSAAPATVIPAPSDPKPAIFTNISAEERKKRIDNKLVNKIREQRTLPVGERKSIDILTQEATDELNQEINKEQVATAIQKSAFQQRGKDLARKIKQEQQQQEEKQRIAQLASSKFKIGNVYDSEALFLRSRVRAGLVEPSAEVKALPSRLLREGYFKSSKAERDYYGTTDYEAAKYFGPNNIRPNELKGSALEKDKEVSFLTKLISFLGDFQFATRMGSKSLNFRKEDVEEDIKFYNEQIKAHAEAKKAEAATEEATKKGFLAAFKEIETSKGLDTTLYDKLSKFFPSRSTSNVDAQVAAAQRALDHPIPDPGKEKVKQLMVASHNMDTVVNDNKNIKDNLKILTDFANKEKFEITSTTEGEHAPNSKHYVGQAIDLRVKGRKPEEITKFVAAAREAGFYINREEKPTAGQVGWSGDHLHMELTNKAKTLALQKTVPPQANAMYAAHPPAQKPETPQQQQNTLPTPTEATSTVTAPNLEFLLGNIYQLIQNYLLQQPKPDSSYVLKHTSGTSANAITR